MWLGFRISDMSWSSRDAQVFGGERWAMYPRTGAERRMWREWTVALEHLTRPVETRADNHAPTA